MGGIDRLTMLLCIVIVVVSCVTIAVAVDTYFNPVLPPTMPHYAFPTPACRYVSVVGIDGVYEHDRWSCE